MDVQGAALTILNMRPPSGRRSVNAQVDGVLPEYHRAFTVSVRLAERPSSGPGPQSG